MERKQAIVLSVLVLGTLMGALDSTIVILAFPTISAGLHSEIDSSIWIILIYLLILAVMTTPLGRVGDIYGRSRMFNAGFTIFTVGSALCGFAPNIELLVFFRGLQAIGGALLQSNSGAIIADVFPRENRGRAFGYNSMGWTIGAMVGILLGGVITTFLGWQFIFFINIPIGGAAVLLGMRYVKDINIVKCKIDLLGVILLAGGLGLISFGAVDFAGMGLTAFNLALVIVGVAVLFAYVSHEMRSENPMVDFSAFKNQILKYSIFAAFFQSLGNLAVVFLIIMYLQGVRGLSPLNASILLIPGYVVGSLLSPLMGRISDKHGSRNITTLGVLMLIVSVIIYLTLRVNSSLDIVLVASAISGLGTSMFFPANNSTVMASARAGSYGSISGLLRAFQNIGILGSFVIAISVASASIPRAVAFEIFLGTTDLTGRISQVFIMGIDTALLVSLGLLVLAGVLSFARGKESVTKPES
jgi:EmrB/QacA subfamily drug resistance transporter